MIRTPEFDPLTAVLVSGPTNGSLVLNPDGSFTYIHDGSETIADVFQYRVSDGSDSSNVASVTITIVPVNDAPIGVDDSFTVSSGIALTEFLGVAANDTDAEFDRVIAVLAAGPSNGTLSLNADGSFTYTPDAGFYGIDAFTYLPNDGSLSGNLTTVTIDVAAVPQPEPDPDQEPVEETDTDTPVDPPIESEELEPEDEPIAEEESDPGPELPVNSIPTTLTATTRIVDFSEFESVEEIQEVLQLLADREQAQAVLKMLVANSSPGIVQDSEDIRRLRLESGVGLAFDANYLWDQFEDLGEDQTEAFGIQATIGAVTSIGAIGYIFWTLRGGVLVAAALSQLPSWRMIDPLPVLENYSAQNRKNDDDIAGNFFA